MAVVRGISLPGSSFACQRRGADKLSGDDNAGRSINVRMLHFALSMRMGTLILCRTLVAVVPRNMSARKRWP
jgi:hypothetical protein